MTFNYKRFYAGKSSNPAGTRFGYPVPGPQGSNADQIAAQSFFANAANWDAVANAEYDFIVIGSGPTGVAFCERTLTLNPHARILMLERGGFWLPVHYQMLPQAFQATTGSPPTTYPWSRTSQMATNGNKFFQAGYIPVIGGRSTYWSAWSPSPGPELMRDWPQELIGVTLKPGFWEGAREFLHVCSMDQVDNGVYGKLQRQLDVNLRENFKSMVPSAEHAYPAPIAVGNTDWQGVKFYKYSTVGTLLGLQQRQQALAEQGQGSAMTIVDSCTVRRLQHDDHGMVNAIATSRGMVAVGPAKIVLAMGTIPPATLLMNSFGPQLPCAGQRYTGHFMSHVTARVPRSAFRDLAPLELAALYLDGRDRNGLQYHVQTSAFASLEPERDAGTIAREAPDAAAVASATQLDSSRGHVVFVCATLGEVSEANARNWIRLNGGDDPTTNISLQLELGEDDRRLWDTLDEATYQTIEAMVRGSSADTSEIEYWTDEPGDKGFWTRSRPAQAQIRLNIIVHEASPLWIGGDPASSVVGFDYRPHGVQNVYVTGASLFPTSGSWNPTLTMCGLAQDLAERLA